MLVLGRKNNESIIIDDNIVVTILAVEGDRVKIGIQAPPRISILRQELYDSVKSENLRAVRRATDNNEQLLSSLQQLFKPKDGQPG